MKYLIVALCVGTALARPDGAGHGGHHDHGHAAPAAAPSSGYQEPSAGYQEPAYQEPAYAAAPSGYEQPAYESGYGAPTGGYSSYDAVQEPSNGLNLNLIIIPILIIAGLALLFPSVTTVAVKRKRSAEEGELHKHSTYIYIHYTGCIQTKKHSAFMYQSCLHTPCN